MKYYSTKNKENQVSLKEAVLKGLAADNGLFMPQQIPQMPKSFFQNIANYSFQEISLEVAKAFFHEDISYAGLKKIVFESLNFPTPMVDLEGAVKVLELWHGPTLAFKDVGARFMARMVGHYSQKSDTETHILVATSGDTGSAVANGFLNVPNIKVTILYPSGGVSLIQEKQLTTLGNNIKAIEVKGTFDDCQRLVKAAFLDEDLNKKLTLTSANSINLARLIPQSFYYFNAFAQLKDKSNPLVISVPSGNFGNLTAGLIAKRMGLPIEKFVVSNNRNNVVTEYLNDGIYNPRESVQTLSNAMDVGDPSNFDRMMDLYDHSAENIRKDLVGYYFTDEQTTQCIEKVYNEFGYILDPHGAVGYLGLKSYMETRQDVSGIFLETAHPAKFLDTVKDSLGIEVELPESLAKCMNLKKESTVMSNEFEELKEYLLNIR